MAWPGYYTGARTGQVWQPASYDWSPNGYIYSSGYWDYDPFNRGLLFAPVWFDRPLWQTAGWYYRPFYALDTRWAGGLSGQDDLQTDSLYDRGQITDQFQDQHESVQVYGGWSNGLHNGWVRRWSTGVTYDEHRFSPVSTWTGVTEIPEDRRFLYPWVQFDLLQDDYLKLINHDQIARTEDFYLGTTASVRVGWADSAAGSSHSALLFQSFAGRGFCDGGTSTLLLASDFSGRLENGGDLHNGVLDASVRYYVEQGRNWLFFTTLQVFELKMNQFGPAQTATQKDGKDGTVSLAPQGFRRGRVHQGTTFFGGEPIA